MFSSHISLICFNNLEFYNLAFKTNRQNWSLKCKHCAHKIAFRARTVIGTFEKRAPARLPGSYEEALKSLQGHLNKRCLFHSLTSSLAVRCFLPSSSFPLPPKNVKKKRNCTRRTSINNVGGALKIDFPSTKMHKWPKVILSDVVNTMVRAFVLCALYFSNSRVTCKK